MTKTHETLLKTTAAFRAQLTAYLKAGGISFAESHVRRYVKANLCHKFRGFSESKTWPPRFNTYYFAHRHSARDYLLGVKQPKGACLSALNYIAMKNTGNAVKA
jgi:hypothetical protein